MSTYDYENALASFKWLAAQAANWTHDMRGLHSNTKPVYAALLKLKNYDQDDHSVTMTTQQRDDIVSCLRTVHWAATNSGYDGASLENEAMNLLETLNKLFKKEGLDSVTDLYKK